jgi:hypothetical protein
MHGFMKSYYGLWFTSQLFAFRSLSDNSSQTLNAERLINFEAYRLLLS